MIAYTCTCTCELYVYQLGGEGGVLGGVSTSDQTTDTSAGAGTQKEPVVAPVTMTTGIMGSRDEVVAIPNGTAPTTTTASDSYVYVYVHVHT